MSFIRKWCTMNLYYVEICKRINMFAIGTYKEYFVSEKGVERYIDFFNKYLYSEDEMWISSQGQAYINANDMIVADEK